MIVKSFEQAGIKLPRTKKEGTIKVLCPRCSHLRTKKDDPCLSVTFNKVTEGKPTCHLFNCHHCKFTGAVHENGLPEFDPITFTRQTRYQIPKLDYSDYELDDETIEWFGKRGISERILQLYDIKSCLKSFDPQTGEETTAMFPLLKGDKLINIQYRNLGDAKKKRYRTIGGCQLTFFGLNNVVIDNYIATDTLVITEGYIDALSCAEAGFVFTLSVPNGSPYEKAGDVPIKTPELQYLDDPDAQKVLKHVKKIILFGDDDHQGRRLVEELATRIGVEKCWRVRHPEGCKDANDVLRKYGKEKLTEVIENAVRMPVAGVVTIGQIRDNVKQRYERGPDPGLSTGFSNLDKIFRFGQGRMAVVTGVPQSGKSRFVSNLLVNVGKLHGAKSSWFTPESRPFENFAEKIAQIYTGKPFHGQGRMTEKEMTEALDWMENYITFNNCEERTIQAITDIWKSQLASDGVRYGVLDPFNYLNRASGTTEIDFILSTLTYLSNWCITNNFFAFVVAHPTKMKVNSKQEYPVLEAYDIAGSAHWFNTPDVVLSIWRSRKKKSSPVQLHVKKMKQEENGEPDKLILLDYEVRTGVYTPCDDLAYRPCGLDEAGCPAYEEDGGDFEDDAEVSRDVRRPFEDDENSDSKPRRTRNKEK